MKRFRIPSILAFFLLLAVLLSAALATAANNSGQQLFDQANKAYSAGNYQQAIDDYLAFADQNGVSASLLYNLANSYAASGQTGLAVVNYKRALRLAPGDGDIQANLEQVRKDAGLYRDDKPVYEQLADLLAADQWLMLAAAAFCLLAVILLAANLAPANRKFLPIQPRLPVILTLLVITVTLPAALFRYQAWHDGVVQGEEARLLISPFAEAASSGTIKAGRLIRPGKSHGDFVLIRDETGRSGWLHQKDFQRIAELPAVE
jgi:tetratricopeptide (TPR) repeat protein